MRCSRRRFRSCWPGSAAGAGWEWLSSLVTDETSWIEHRAWLRTDTSVFFVYTTLDYDITVTDSGGRTRTIAKTGLVELVTDLAGALALGIPELALQSVVPKSKRLKEFGRELVAPKTRARRWGR